MRINVKFVDECPNGEYGTTEVLDNNTIGIEISRDKNKEQAEFFVTLLHEMLHAWILVLKANGLRMSLRREHRWIYSVQAVVVKAIEIMNKKKKRRPK